MGTELKKVLNWVSKNKSLRNLAIGYNKIPDSVATKLAKVVANPECRLSKLDIKMCDISSKPLEEIAKSLATNSSLEAVSLSGNVLKKKAGMALSKSLIANKTIKILSLRSCSIQKVFILSYLVMY